MDTRLMRTYFLAPAEFVLISVCDNTVRTDSVSWNFSLLQISVLVPALWMRWIQQD